MACLYLNACHYGSMFYFFRSSPFNLSDIKHQWLCVVQQHIKPVKIDGRSIVIGDHIKVGKEARYMPGVKNYIKTPKTWEKKNTFWVTNLV